MLKKVILVSGYKDSGKDFVSDMLSTILQCETVAFAEPMKDILSVMFGVSKDDLNKYKKDEEAVLAIGDWGYKKITDFRTVIQKFGSEAMKPVFGNDVWINLLLQKIDPEAIEYIIVSDWRFINEYEGVNDMYDVVTVRVDDHNLDAGTHDSEHQLDEFNFDHRINNTGHTDNTPPQIRALAMLILSDII